MTAVETEFNAQRRQDRERADDIYIASAHISHCPVLTGNGKAEVSKCGKTLHDTVKTGFHPGDEGQWKAFCTSHGFIYYDIA